MTDFSLVGDLVARERRSETPALYAAGLDRTYSYFDLCNTACKAGNVLSHVGVREGDRVVVDAAAAPQPVFTFLGAALLGAVTEFDVDPDRGCDARAVVVPVEREDEFDLPGGSKLVAFGGDPAQPATTYWEEEVWSENPAFPPTFHDPTDPVLRSPAREADADVGADRGADRTYSHAELLTIADDAVETLSLDADSRLALRAPLSDPRAVAAGVLAPLSVSGTVALPDGDAPLEATATVTAHGAPAKEGTAQRGNVPEESLLSVDSIPLPSR